MKKAVVNIIYIASLSASVVTVHEAFAGRSPSVEPLTEVNLEDSKSPKDVKLGYNFEEQQIIRNPAGIVAKNSNSSPYSFIGPIIFILALPLAIWLVLARKFSDKYNGNDDRIGYYPKTFQFKPHKTDYQRNDDQHNDDDNDLPKAS